MANVSKLEPSFIQFSSIDRNFRTEKRFQQEQIAINACVYNYSYTQSLLCQCALWNIFFARMSFTVL